MNNNNQSDFFIGATNLNRTTASFSRHQWFYVKENTDNIYRILPPVRSLAKEGRVAQWHSVHRGMKAADGKARVFMCVAVKNKEGFITRHCPACDRAAELEAQLELTIKQGQCTKERAKELRMQHIYPLAVDKKFYLNVVNRENKIGIISIGYKMYKSLEALMKAQQAKGFDITGMEGVFVNFKKSSSFKGDRDAVHSAEMYMEPSSDGSFRYVTHVITPEFTTLMRQSTADLPNLFKEISVDQISALVSSEGADRANLLTSLYNSAESAEESSGLEARLPGTDVSVVTTISGNLNAFQVNAPTVPAAFTAPPVVNQNVGSFPQQATVVPIVQSAPLAKGSNPFGNAQAASAVAFVGKANPASLTDEDFLALTKPAGK